MKSLIALIMICLCSLAVASEKPQKPIVSLELAETINVNKYEDVIKAKLPGQHPNIKVVGQYKVSTLKKNHKLVQILWTAVANEKKQTSALDPPLISVVTVKHPIPAGRAIPFTGDGQEILHAIEQLQTGESQETTVKQIDNPQSRDRHVALTPHNSQNTSAKSKVSQNNDNQTAPVDSSLTEDPSSSQEEYSSASSDSSSSLNNLTSYRYSSPTEGLSLYTTSPSKREKKKRHRASSFQENNHADPVLAEDLITNTEKCLPRIDELQDRVVLQEKTILKQGDKIVQETPCQDTFENFIIKRDYTCPDCHDHIDYAGRVAYSRYRKYWVDSMGERHDLNDRLYIEEDNPHPFLEERGQCTTSKDLNPQQAHLYVQTVYYGRGNKRVVVKDCYAEQQTQEIQSQEIMERRNAYEYTIDSFGYPNHKQFKCTYVEISDNPAPKFYKLTSCMSDAANVFSHKELNCYIYQRPCVQTRQKKISKAGKETVTPWVIESVGNNYAAYCYIMCGVPCYYNGACAYPGGMNPNVPLKPNRVN